MTKAVKGRAKLVVFNNPPLKCNSYLCTHRNCRSTLQMVIFVCKIVSGSITFCLFVYIQISKILISGGHCLYVQVENQQKHKHFHAANIITYTVLAITYFQNSCNIPPFLTPFFGQHLHLKNNNKMMHIFLNYLKNADGDSMHFVYSISSTL